MTGVSRDRSLPSRVLHPRREVLPYVEGLHVVTGVTYGPVNVRTDGRKILCATRDEKSASWDVKTFESRF